MGLVSELRRRNVFRMAALYVVAAWLIMQVAEVIIGLANLPEWLGPTVLALLAVGFPIALVLSWFYELTPEGISLESDAKAAVPAKPFMGRRVDIIVIALLCAGLLLFAYDKWWTGPPIEKSIAVLPFENLSPDHANEYFSDGMTAELISKLSRIQDLTVTARTSVLRFKDSDKDIREIGAELGVPYVLEGSVRKSDDRVRISAQLINASTGLQLWADDFDSGLMDIFDVQEETALEIAAALGLVLSSGEEAGVRRRATVSTDAYDAYLQGWALIESWNIQAETPQKLESARQHFDRALSHDADYELAYVGLAFVETYYYLSYIDGTFRTGSSDIDEEEILDHLVRGKEYVDRALALDPELSEAHAVLGDILAGHEEWSAAIASYREAIRLGPQNAYAWEELAWALNRIDPPRPLEAEEAAREAIRLDPTYVWNYFQLAVALKLQEREDDSIATLQHVLEIDPSFRSASLELARQLLDRGEYSKALDRFETELEISIKRDDIHQAWLQRAIADAHASLGDAETAFVVLESALESGYTNFTRLRESPHLEPIRDDPRFQALLDKYEDSSQ
jgi:TolB-like protein/cytochrome c-type biogenesis protein CcmH/NrfG